LTFLYGSSPRLFWLTFQLDFSFFFSLTAQTSLFLFSPSSTAILFFFSSQCAPRAFSGFSFFLFSSSSFSLYSLFLFFAAALAVMAARVNEARRRQGLGSSLDGDLPATRTGQRQVGVVCDGYAMPELGSGREIEGVGV
jgi:hypothetical protein